MRNMLAARYWTEVDSLPGKVAPVEQSHRHLQHPLYRFLRCVRAETPDGSQPTFVEDETVLICRITQQPSLAPSSFTRHPIGLPYGSLSLPGERRAYHVPPLYPHGLGLASTPGVLHLRPVTLEHRFLTPYLLVQAS